MTALQKIEQMPLGMNIGFTHEQIELIKNTVCKGASDDEFQMFLYVCKRTGLDPLMKQIYSIPRGGQRTNQVSIDGFRLIAERTGRYAPGKETMFAYDKDGSLLSATYYIKKQTLDGTWHEISATAFFQEYNANTPFWKKMPHNQLAKCAETLALRKAFPAEMSGIYSNEEMEQAPTTIEAIEPEFSKEEIDLYLDKWKDQKEEFRNFLEDTMKVRKWTARKTIEAFQKNLEYTTDRFNMWLAKA